MKKTPKRKSRKSYRTPPANYQGLGSLTMLKELKKDKSSQEGEDAHTDTEAIRKKVYLVRKCCHFLDCTANGMG